MAHPIYEANENSPYGNLSRDEFYKKHKILHRESFMKNEQNMKTFTQSWQPDHIPDIQPLVCDCINYFDSARADHQNLPPFLYGESLGAALAVLVCLKQRTAWKGLVLSGAMCEISKKFRPMWPIEKLLPAAAFIAPSWRIVITQPPASRSYKEEWKRKLIERSPTRKTCGRPTAASALQLLKVCEYVKRNCHELEVPMLIVHGGEDMICDPEGAKFLYESSTSKDKTLKIFTGMWHQLTGEPNDSAEQVFNTILSWIEVRADLSNTE